MKTRRVGHFFVDRAFFRELDVGEGTNLFHQMVVLNVDHEMWSNRVKYHAAHPDFRELAVGEITPEYRAVFTPDSPFPQWQEVKS